MKLFQKPQGDLSHYCQPDPFIFEHQGVYYIYATHKAGVQVYKSANFTDWEYLGILFTRKGWKQFWAPCVMEYDGKLYLYYSAQPEEESDAHTQRIQVAVGDHPEGPFAFVREILPPFSIDAHVISEKEGVYIVYSTNDTDCERPGTLVVLDKMIDPIHAEGNPVVAVRATMDEEVYAFHRFREGEHWHTIEGGCYYRRGETHYLLYSGAGFGTDRYFVGYAVAHGTPEDLRDLRWRKYPDEHTFCPLVFRNEFMEGTGHNSLVEKDGELWIVYHARDRKGVRLPGLDYRIMRADKVVVEGDKLTVSPTQ